MNMRNFDFRLLAAAALLSFTMPSAHASESTMADWVEQQDTQRENLAIVAMTIDGDNVSHVAKGVSTPGGEMPDEMTQFQIGSITKAMTNLLLAEMVAADKVRYDTTVAEILGKDFAPKNAAVSKITLQALATHSSGLPRLPANLAVSDPLDPYKGYDNDKLIEGLATARMLQPLGNHYAYSNFGVGLLGYLLGEVHGEGYATAMQQYVLEPLGLKHTGTFDTDNQAAGFSGGDVVPAWDMTDSLAGAGALWGSTADFERIARVLLGDTPSALKHALADDLAVAVKGGDGYDVTRVWHVAYDGEQPVYWHNGGTGGFSSFFGFRLDTHQAIAIFVSGDSDPTEGGLAALNAQPAPVASGTVDAQALGQYTLTPQFGIGIVEQDGQLIATPTGQPPYALSPVKDDWYALNNVDASIHFVREDDQITGLELAQGGVLQPAQKTADTAASLSVEVVELSTETLAQYTGEFALGPGATFTIRPRDGGLEAKLTGQAFYPIFAKGDDVFFYKIVAAELHFQRDDAGVINALVLHQGGMEQRAEKQ
ncbi:MAG: serine hydrolase [Pseudomonadota bacterium]